MNRYPREWPGFEILEDGWILPAGAIVEGVGVYDDAYDEDHNRVPGFGVACRVLDDTQILHEPRRGPDGWAGIVCLRRILRPLTDAAREMLDAAMET